MHSFARALLAAAAVLATALPARADIGVIVLEPIRALGYLTRAGHAATYLSNICPDGSPVRMRLCRPGERGGVVSRYSGFSAQENFDWAIVPLDAFLHGTESPDLAPLIGTRNLRDTLEQRSFERLFADTLKSKAEGLPPEGQWRSTVANRFGRSLYIFSVATRAEDDAAIIEAFNSSPNVSQFNFFYTNCSNQTKAVFDLVFRSAIGDRFGGLTMETPKGLVKTLVSYAQNHPELPLLVRRYPQIPGTFSRSREILFPMENTYRSLAFTPYWFFGGYREVAVAALFYHTVVSPFSLSGAIEAFASPQAAQLTVEQHTLRLQQDTIARALASATRGDKWPSLANANARLVVRLDEIGRAQRAEVLRVRGSAADWRARADAFRSLVVTLTREGLFPSEVRQAFVGFRPGGQLSEALLRYLEARGTYSVDDAGRGPWISLPFEDGRRTTGLSRAQVLAGDPRVAVLVLAASLDYNLYQPEARREDIASVDGLLTLFQQAIANLH